MTESATPTVLYQERGPVAVITLNRPAALNSFTRQMHHDLWAALDNYRYFARRCINSTSAFDDFNF